MGVTVSLYLQKDTVEAIDEMASRENRSRSNMAATLLETSIRALKEARDNSQPYPVVPEAPADCDMEE
jgi:predicted transcriptional regulator